MNLWIRSFNIIWYYLNTYVFFMKYEYQKKMKAHVHVHEKKDKKPIV